VGFGAFAAAVRSVSDGARRLGLRPPDFRSPPRRAADRTLRRRADGTVVVAVRVQGRPAPEVVADVIEGVVTANGLEGAAADRCRHALQAAAAGTLPGPWTSAP
jgi:hypothetical protein